MSGPTLQLSVDGRQVEVADDGRSLLDVLRDDLGYHSAKDGCSPQGQCGCCTVLVDGAPRVACVTPARRVAGRSVTTLDGLPEPTTAAWGAAMVDAGGSQCGFCTPGIIVRLEGLRAKGVAATDRPAVERALQAHLCRCTGWQTIVEAWEQVAGSGGPGPGRLGDVAGRDLEAAGRRAGIEGRAHQRVAPEVALGRGGFAADTAPADALVAVPDGAGGWSVGDSLTEARRSAGKVQGRRTTAEAVPPLDLPEGDWDVTLRTSWVEPAYLEPDAAWCEPGAAPSSPAANGGAFGGKDDSPAPAAARALADRFGRPVLVVLSREDVVRLGPKRPPIAAGIRADGRGIVRVVRTPGIAERIRSVAPGLEVVEVDVAGPATSRHARAAGWAEAAVLLAALEPADGGPVEVQAPGEGAAGVVIDEDGTVHIRVGGGDPLDEVVMRSYAIGAAHMAIGWVTSEALSVDADGVVHDLTIRSFGVLRAIDTPRIEVEIETGDGPPVNTSDAVFAAVAAAVWRHQGRSSRWPTRIPLRP